ncbi:hypothetical protein QEZ54_01765 [Catellatospora sp. KI3]|uniref:hypothetical protein n=1 Tax=Catellatospora sp. KI3 TaxID=3041620 RepID=UPI00248295BB|nr:hypothetical protein [Catellatospora sp. KI3]MDI1459685.1 hypothetical protein [Catellatospora sp. KI3]
MRPMRRVVAALALGSALAVAPMAMAHAGSASTVKANCFRAWLSSTVEFGATGTFSSSGSGTGEANVSAILYYHDTDWKDDTFNSAVGWSLVSTSDTYSPVTGGSNYNVDAAAWVNGSPWKYNTCYIT